MSKFGKFAGKPVFVSCAFFLLSVVIVLIIFSTSTNSGRQAHRYFISKKALSQANKIQHELLIRVNFAQALASFIEHNPALTQDEFNRFVESLLQHDGGVVASMAYSPDLQIKMIWPDNKVNDAIINKVLTEKPGRKYFLKKCVSEKKAYIEGPSKFAHLDSALCLFTPVQIRNQNDTTSTQPRYDVADVTIRWSKFLEISDLNNADSNVNVAIRGINGTGRIGEVFYGDTNTFNKPDAVIIPIELPMGEWIMAVSPAKLYTPDCTPHLISILLAFIVSVTVYCLLRYSNKKIINLSEPRYSYVFENSHNIIWIADYKTLQYKYVSESCKQHTGYSPEEYSKMTLSQTCSPYSLAKAMENIEAAIANVKTGKMKVIETVFELQLYTKWGTKNWLETFVVAITNNHGEVDELIGFAYDINEKKKLEIAFRESERRYKLIAENSNDFIWVLDADTMNCNFVSASTVNVTGFTPEDMLGKRVAIFMPPLSYNVLAELFEIKCDSISKTEKYNFEIQVYKKDDSLAWISMIVKPVFDENDNLKELIINAKNIDKQKKLELELSEIEKKFLAITVNTHDYIWIQDAKTMKFNYISAASEYVCGYTPEEMKNFTNKDLYPPETVKLVQDIISQKTNQFKSGEIDKLQSTIELQQYHKNSSLVWVEVSTFTRIDEKNNPVEYLGITRNINDRKTLEIALKESETKYRLITENTKDIIWAANLATWQYTFVNDAIYSSIGFKADEFVGMTLKDTTPPSTFNYIEELTSDLIKQYEEGKKTAELIRGATVEVQIYNKAGDLLWAEVSFNIIGLLPAQQSNWSESGSYHSDRLGQVIAVVRIIEDRKKLEFAMQEKQKELSLANATKDRFFSIIAHDLKNPLSSLLQLSELLAVDFQKQNKSALNEEIHMLKDTLSNTYKFLENLLEWSRTNMGTIIYSPSKQNIIKIINDCLDYLKIQSVTKNISVDIQIDDTVTQEEFVCWVNCDAHMIHTVLRNLLSNAIKFSFKGTNITTTISEYSVNPQYVCVAVKDAGTGIAEDDTKKLFRINEKIISAKGTEDESGTGLGLILCKEFIDKHNTTIWVESRLGAGTTFFFTLPKWVDIN